MINNSYSCCSILLLPDFNEDISSILVSGLLIPIDSYLLIMLGKFWVFLKIRNRYLIFIDTFSASEDKFIELFSLLYN